MGVTLALMVDDKGTVYMTPGMRERVSFEEEPPRVLIAGEWIRIGNPSHPERPGWPEEGGYGGARSKANGDVLRG